MTHTYTITGMTCSHCVSKVKSELLKLGDVTEAEVQLNHPQATITMLRHIPVSELQDAISKAGHYTISEAGLATHTPVITDENRSWLNTYKPILIIGAYLTGVTVLVELGKESFNLQNWMNNFMAGFFLVFSFFKLLDLKGFSETYSTYDIIAKKWFRWGYVYSFIELLLGIFYLLKFNQLFTNILTFVIMSLSIIGVIQSVLNKRKIRCACLGAVFNLPMSTITIIEDALMIAMSAVMLFMI